MNNLVNCFVPVADYNSDSLLDYKYYAINHGMAESQNLY